MAARNRPSRVGSIIGAALLASIASASAAASEPPKPPPTQPPAPLETPPGQHGVGIPQCGPVTAAVRGGDGSTACLPDNPGPHGTATVRRGVGTSKSSDDSHHQD